MSIAALKNLRGEETRIDCGPVLAVAGPVLRPVPLRPSASAQVCSKCWMRVRAIQ
jgi:hypothetical protein